MDYLIWLQNLRGELGTDVEHFFMLFTDGSAASTIFLPAIIFWCIDKRTGKFLFIVYAFGRLLNTFLKNTLCVYHPYVFDSNIHPAESAMLDASHSYAFPSGNNNIATASYGGVAYVYGRKFPILAVICVAVILLTAFTRVFFGLHTVDDVLFSIILTAILIVLIDKLMWLIGDSERNENIFTCAVIVLALIMTAYFTLKSYPVDYIDGKIILDPNTAIKDAIGNIGTFIGILIGLDFERRFINFKSNVKFSQKIFRAVIGIALIFAVYFFVLPYIKTLPIGMAANFLSWFTLNFSITFFIPLIFVQLEPIFFRNTVLGGSYFGR